MLDPPPADAHAGPYGSRKPIKGANFSTSSQLSSSSWRVHSVNAEEL